MKLPLWLNNKKYPDYLRKAARKAITEIKCDICGTKGKINVAQGGRFDDFMQDTKVEWPDPEYGETTTTIEIKREAYYGGDGGFKEAFFFDLCPKCFREKLVEWFKSHGAEPQESDCHW
jgi:hypothetical protein